MKKITNTLLLTGLVALFITSCKKDKPGSGDAVASCDASFTTSAAAFYVQFTPTVVGDAQLSSHLWNFGGDETSTEAAPLHAFPAAGNYSVKHIFRKLDAAGNILCTDTSIMSQSVINDSIFVQISTPTVEYNTFDYVTFSAKDKSGNDITSSCSFTLNNSATVNYKYIPTTTGSFSIRARRNNQPSSVATLSVVPKTASPFTQKILMEDMTGAWCGYCTRGTYLIETYKATHPAALSIAIHGGGGTDPYKFQYYTTYNSQFNISGYPTIILNRKSVWNESTSVLDLALQKWAPLGMAISSTVNGTDITGTVKVKFNVNTEKEMKIVIALVENNLIYPQVNYYSPQYGATPYLYGGVSPVSNFQHNTVLRRTSTDLFGDAIPVSAQTKNNIYEVPFTMSLNGSVFGGGTYSAIPANCAIIATVVDASSSNAGSYNSQSANAGTTVNFD
jgi:hypothetical protein